MASECVPYHQVMPDTFFSKRTFVQWLSKIHFIQFTTQENLQFTWEPLPTRECVWDTGISKEMVGQALFDGNNRPPPPHPWLGLTNVIKIGGDQSPRPHTFRWTWFAWGCQWMAIYLQHKTKRPRESVNWSKFYGWRHKHFSRQKWNFQCFGLIFVYGDSNLSS